MCVIVPLVTPRSFPLPSMPSVEFPPPPYTPVGTEKLKVSVMFASSHASSSSGFIGHTPKEEESSSFSFSTHHYSEENDGTFLMP